MKKFAAAIFVFEKNGLYDLEVVFVEAKDHRDAYAIGLGQAHIMFPVRKGYSNHSVVVKEVV